MVAGERSARAVRPAQPRREADHQQTRTAVAERGDRAVVPVGERGTIRAPQADQPRAKGAINCGRGARLQAHPVASLPEAAQPCYAGS